MSIEALVEQFKTQAANASPIGGTIKFVVDGNPLFD